MVKAYDRIKAKVELHAFLGEAIEKGKLEMRGIGLERLTVEQKIAEANAAGADQTLIDALEGQLGQIELRLESVLRKTAGLAHLRDNL